MSNLIVKDSDIEKIDHIPEPDFNMKFVEYDDKLLKHLKRLIRGSLEYVSLMNFLKTSGFSSCVFHPGYDMKNGLKIEMHHEPFTITDIIRTVCDKQLKLNKFFTERSICNEVMESHYNFEVGLVPLCPTCHELRHNNEKLKIHPKSVICEGWKLWYEKYKSFADDLVCEKYEKFAELMKKDVAYPEIISKKNVYLEVKSQERISDKECHKLLIDSKIDNLEVLKK